MLVQGNSRATPASVLHDHESTVPPAAGHGRSQRSAARAGTHRSPEPAPRRRQGDNGALLLAARDHASRQVPFLFASVLRVSLAGLPTRRRSRGRGRCRAKGTAEPRQISAERAESAHATTVTTAVDEHAGRVIVVSAIDNLGKGAAGQALQNANLVLGLEETAGLTANGVAP